MRIAILALGSLGDVLPLLTLGVGLQRAGHQVSVATFENFAARVSEHGLGYLPVAGNARSLLQTPRGRAIGQSGQNTVRLTLAMLGTFGPLATGFARAFSAVARDGADLIVNQLPGGLYGLDLAERLGVPQVLASVIPLAPTRSMPMLAFPSGLSWIPGYNRLTHWLAYQLVWQVFRPPINRWRREELGLTPAPFWGHFEATRRLLPILNGFSSLVVPRPQDWGAHIHQTGYWFPPLEGWQPSDDLRQILDQEPRPIFIGFGSMPVPDPTRMTAMVIDALRKSGQRGILQAGWGGLIGHDLPPELVMIDEVPYQWLFPRLSAVVHHGGAGTTAHGLQAGVPSVIVPFTFDQFYWARRIFELGVGPPAIPFRRLTSASLGRAFRRAVEDRDLQARAGALGAGLRAEDGLQKAVKLIDSLAQ